MVSERVLIIDDEPKIGEFIAEVAVELGHSVQVTSKPSDFKCLVDSFEPTVICLDIIMPEKDGIELMRYLADQECQARVLVISGYHGQYLEIAHKLGTALGLRSVTTLNKPVGLSDLRNALSTAH